VFTVAFVTQTAGLVGLLAALPFFPSAAPGVRDLAWGAAAGVAASVGLALLYRGLATGIASVVAPVTAVCAIVVPVLADFTAGVVPRVLVLIGIVTAMAAVALLSQSGGEAPAPGADAAPGAGATPRTRGIALAIASGVAIGVFLTCLARAGATSGLWPLLASRSVAVVGFGAVCLARSLPLAPPPGALRPSVASGLLDVAANVLYLVAVRAGTLGPIATLVSLYPASTVALAGIVWRERLRPVQNAGLALAFAAIVLITWRPQ
jgi:drug/metabolite transporter (DMT)-like permease